MTHLNIAYLQGKQNGGGNSKKVEIVSTDDSVSIEKTETASEVSFDISTNTSEHDITSVDKTVVVSGDRKQGHDLSAKTSILRKVFINDDAAVAQLGSDYRMPSVEDFRELIDYCSVEKLVNQFTYGFYLRYTSKVNGNSILFPLVTDGEGESHVETNYPDFIGDLDGFDEQGFRVCSDEEWSEWIDGGYIRAYYWTSSVNYHKNTHDYEQTCPYSFVVGEDYYVPEEGSWRVFQVLGESYYAESNYHRGYLIRPISPFDLDDTIDLGLPSGARWRKFNLGVYAEWGQETDNGNHFAWGETESRDWSESGQYDKSYYKYYDEENDRNSKYNYDSRGVIFDSLDNVDGVKLVKGQLVVDDTAKLKKFIDVDGNEYPFSSEDEELRLSSDGTIGIEENRFTEEYQDEETGETKKRKVREVALSVQSVGSIDLYIYSIYQFVQACETIAQNYGQSYNMYIMSPIDFTYPSSFSGIRIHLAGEDYETDWDLCDSLAMTWDFRVLFRYTKIIGYGGFREFRTLIQDRISRVNDTVTLCFDTINAENIRFGGSSDSLYKSAVKFKRPLLKANGNGWWKFYNCMFEALGEETDDNPFFEIGDMNNNTRYSTSLYHCDMGFSNCKWNCAASQNDWRNTTAPISISCSAAQSYMHQMTFFNATKQLTSQSNETGILAVHVTGHTWEVQTDGSVKIIGKANDNSTRSYNSIHLERLETTSKTAEGGINENKERIDNIDSLIADMTKRIKTLEELHQINIGGASGLEMGNNGGIDW